MGIITLVLPIPPMVSWNLKQDNTVWAIVQFNFADYLMYLNDEWGTSTPENEVAFDPTAIPTIAFDVKSDANVGASDAPVEYWWSSNVNEWLLPDILQRLSDILN